MTYNGKSVNILAIDVARNGFNIAKKAMDDLTNGQAAFLGRIEATAVQVDRSACVGAGSASNSKNRVVEKQDKAACYASCERKSY